jgi:hypothetical protein
VVAVLVSDVELVVPPGVVGVVVAVLVSELEVDPVLPEEDGAVPTGFAHTPPLDVPPLGLVIGPH